MDQQLKRNVHIGTHVAPLGLRFWDITTRNYVGDGLDVTACPLGQDRRVVRATLNSSRIWVFHHLPGCSAFERALPPGITVPVAVDNAFWSSPALGADKRAYLVRVTDRLGRFVPVEFAVNAPVRELFKFTVPVATGLPAGPGAAVPLFPAAARRTSPGMAVIRADLVAPAGTGRRPLAWAVLRAAFGATTLAWALTDREGHATLMFPYPAATTGVGTPPPLPARTWNITLSAWFKPPTDEVPEYAALDSVLAQPPIGLLKTLSPAVPLGPVTLRFGEALAVKSDDAEGFLWAQ
jgi:hypothetical protein